jgi:serine/threonine protein kinase/tetratricopeptide (TPR) repeat protein
MAFDNPSPESVARRDAPVPAPAPARAEAAGVDDDDPHSFDPLDVANSPKRLGHYVLLEKLGHGGMGVVYAAYDEQLDRKVAIKLLRARASENTHQRLIREAQAMARLSHPNVVQIYEIEKLDDRTCVVMEFVDGVTLRDWMAQKRRSRSEILEVFIAAGRGLSAAHEKALIHRDFKPDNVMISLNGRVKVMDFGLARGEEESEAAPSQPAPPVENELRRVNALTTDLTADGAVIGTPAYMAPEQIEGRRTDSRTDQFSFCVTLWEALFERRPFSAGSLSEMSDVIAVGKFDAPERSKVPSWLRRVLRRGLASEPADRWPSMDALLDALARDPTRRRRTWAMSVVAISLLAVGIVLLGSREDTPEHEPSAADLSTCELASREIEDSWNADVHQQLAAAFQATELSYAAAAWARASEWMNAYASEWSRLRSQTCFEARSNGLEHSEEALAIAACLDERRASFAALADAWADADALTVTRALTAAASLPPAAWCTNARQRGLRVRPPKDIQDDVLARRAELARVAALRLAGKFEAGRELAGSVRAHAQTLAWRPLEAEAELAVGRLQDELGDYEAAQVSLQRAYLAAIAGGNDLLALEAVTTLTLVVGDKLAQLDAGLRWGQLGSMFIERLGLEDSLQEVELLYALGLIGDRMGNYPEALRSLERALGLATAQLGPQHPEVARQLNGLGGVYWSQHDWERALATQVRALEIVEAAFGSEHPEFARSLTNKGSVLSRLGQHEQALAAQRRALQIREDALGPEHPDVATTLNAIGSSLALQGEYTLALDAHRRALRMFEAELGPNHVTVAATLDKLAAVQLGRGDPLAALSAGERALPILEAQLGATHHELADTLATLGRAYAQLGRREAARKAIERAIEIRAAAPEPDLAAIAELRNVLSIQGP